MVLSKTHYNGTFPSIALGRAYRFAQVASGRSPFSTCHSDFGQNLAPSNQILTKVGMTDAQNDDHALALLLLFELCCGCQKDV